MPRAIWSGSISFGLVNIPMKLYNAVSRKNVSFHQIDARTGARVKMQRVSSNDGEEVPYEQIVKGYELSPDRYVLVEPRGARRPRPRGEPHRSTSRSSSTSPTSTRSSTTPPTTWRR